MINYLQYQLRTTRHLIVFSIVMAIALSWTDIELLASVGFTVVTVAIAQYATLRRVLKDAKEIQE
jgi:ABC-type transport system involved in cytochrome bd biosynthesis fused ATPase/permease subunit